MQYLACGVGLGRCQLTPAQAKSILAEVADAVVTVANELDTFSDYDAHASDTPEQTRRAWREGIALLR